MRLMGDKIAARRTMTGAGVPVVPGFEGTGDEAEPVFRKEADRIGYPILVKAAGGGGGRGMRVVRSPEGLGAALESARREAQRGFGDPRLFLEKAIEGAHHVEVQVLADGRGGCVHLFERDCSLQRRFQKIVEESPSPLVDDALRDEMGRAAVAAARACGYVNAGTIEFLVGPDLRPYFLEMNTRIQVEHPVTEMVTGIDLVQAQIRIASGEPLPVRQEDVVRRGHALECRVNAEDPGRGFMPSTGRLLLAAFPSGDGIRVDAGVATGDTVSPHYDALLAKIIVHAADRPASLNLMRETLAKTAILGIETNLAFLKALLEDPVFRRGDATTAHVESIYADWRPKTARIEEEALIAVAVAEAARLDRVRLPDTADATDEDVDRHNPWGRLDGFRTGSV